MIVFDLSCSPDAHRFEAWFRSSQDFADQRASGLLMCPHCGSAEVNKAVMAPSVARKGNQVPARRPAGEIKSPASGPADAAKPDELTVPVTHLPPEAAKALKAMAAIQKAVLENSRWVGRDFAKTAREIHYGEREAEPIHGEANLDDAEELAEEGIAVTPLPFPVTPPGSLN